MNEHFKLEAEALFRELGVKIVTGNQYLGVFIGDLSDQDSNVISRVQKWV